jgi:minor extracellular protease Epr
MAGVIAASDNGFGLVGAAPGVSLYVLKIFPKSGGALTSNVIRAVEWAIAQKLDVVNCSFGGDTPSKLEEETYARARRANVLVIAAVGNDASWVRYPAAYPSVVGVGAVDRTRGIASFSNTGAEVDFVAPGVDVVSTMISGKGRIGSITLDDGTSFPLPHSRIRNRERPRACRSIADWPLERFPARNRAEHRPRATRWSIDSDEGRQCRRRAGGGSGGDQFRAR